MYKIASEQLYVRQLTCACVSKAVYKSQPAQYAASLIVYTKYVYSAMIERSLRKFAYIIRSFILR